MNAQFEAVGWSRNTVIYEVNLRQYTPEGSVRAFRPHLKRLSAMGVGVLWFMPITPVSRKNRKGSLGSYYACSSYRLFSPEFGILQDWVELVQEAHDLGMKVIIDWVANHTGCDHEWTLSHPDFYKRNNEGAFYDAHGWDDVIDLDHDNPAMRIAMIDDMKYWIETSNIDGFRCDMAMLTPVDFWLQARRSLGSLKPLFWLAELDPLDNPEYMEVFDAGYTWRWMNATRDFYQQGAHQIHHLRQLIELYDRTLLSGFMPAWFTSNHDENSWNGTEMEKYGPMASALAVFSATWKGVPLVYSGQEIPNPKRLQFFDRDPIDWTPGAGMHDFYHQLFSLRKAHPAFAVSPEYGHCHQCRNSVDHHVFSFVRTADADAIMVLINFSQWDLPEIEVSWGDSDEEFMEYRSSEMLSLQSGSGRLSLPPWGHKIYVKNKADH